MTLPGPARPNPGKPSQRRLDRLLPRPLRGRGRRAAYRRAQARRVLAALLLGAAVWLVLGAVLPREVPAGSPVLVAGRSLPAGHVLGSGDLRSARWPADLIPLKAVRDPGDAVGRALAAPVDAGEVLTRARLRGPGLLAAAPAGQVAARVALTDVGATSLVGPGDRVDLLATADGSVVAADATVLAVDAGTAGSGLSSGLLAGGAAGAPGLVVAVGPDSAAAIARTSSGDGGAGMFVVLRRPGG